MNPDMPNPSAVMAQMRIEVIRAIGEAHISAHNLVRAMDELYERVQALEAGLQGSIRSGGLGELMAAGGLVKKPVATGPVSGPAGD